MAKAKRIIKVYENMKGRYIVRVYRAGHGKCYENVSIARIGIIAELIKPGKFTVRPFLGGGLGYVAEEN